MQNVGHEVDQRQAFEHRAAEVGEALALVRAVAVNVVAPEVLLVIDKVEGDPVVDEFFDAHILPAPAEVDVEKQHMFHFFAPSGFDGRVHGQHDAHVRPLVAQTLGQRAHHVRQTAGLTNGTHSLAANNTFIGKAPFTV